jgi:hypothetical protein
MNITIALLPQPLYVLYYNACAYNDAFDGTLEVTIAGSAEQAKQPSANQPARSCTDKATVCLLFDAALTHALTLTHAIDCTN